MHCTMHICICQHVIRHDLQVSFVFNSPTFALNPPHLAHILHSLYCSRRKPLCTLTHSPSSPQVRTRITLSLFHYYHIQIFTHHLSRPTALMSFLDLAVLAFDLMDLLQSHFPPVFSKTAFPVSSLSLFFYISLSSLPRTPHALSCLVLYAHS